MTIITLICAIATLLATVIIGYLQIKHNKVDEENMQSNNKREANEFIAKYKGLYDFIPLAVISYFYNDKKQYQREIYNEFRRLNEDTKRMVVENICQDLTIKKFDNFYEICLNALTECINNNHLDKTQNSIYYDYGKYLENAIERYPELDTYDLKRTYCDMRFIFENSDCPIYELRNKYNFSKIDEENATVFACQVAKLVAIYNGQNNKLKQYGTVAEKNAKDMKLEDDFLLSLYYIYTRLVIKNENNDELES